jgi:hypothetical protein
MQRHLLSLSLSLNLILSLSLTMSGWANSIPQQYPDLIFKSTATGQTHGHVMDLMVYNSSPESVTLSVGPLYAVGYEGNQSFIINHTYETVVPPLSEVVLELSGYCSDHSLPTPGAGTEAGDFEDWVTLAEAAPRPGPNWEYALAEGFMPSSPETGNLTTTFPGSLVEFNYHVQYDDHPVSATLLLIDLANQVETTLADNQNISSDPEELAQMLIWQYTSLLRDDEFTKSDVRLNLIEQVEIQTNQPATTFAESTLQDIDARVENIWSDLSLTGPKAKILTLYGQGGDWTQELSTYFNQELNRIGSADWSDFDQLADSLNQTERHLSKQEAERIRDELGSAYQTFLESQLQQPLPTDWKAWDEQAIDLQGAAFSALATRSLQRQVDSHYRSGFNNYLAIQTDQLDVQEPGFINQWLALEEATHGPAYQAFISGNSKATTLATLSETYEECITLISEEEDESIQQVPRQGKKLQKIIPRNKNNEYSPPKEENDPVREKLRKKLKENLTKQIKDINPTDAKALQDWLELKKQVDSQEFADYLREADQEYLRQLLRDQLKKILEARINQLPNRSKDAQGIALLAEIMQKQLTSFYTDVLTQEDRAQLKEKLAQKIKAWAERELNKLDTDDDDFLQKWTALWEAFNYQLDDKDLTDSFGLAELKKKLLDLIRKWYEEQIDELDPEDENFMKKWWELEKMRKSPWYPKAYPETKTQKGQNKKMDKSYQDWQKGKVKPVETGNIQWDQIPAFDTESKYRIWYHRFANTHPGMEHKAGIPTATYFIVPAVGGGIATWILLTKDPEPPVANDDVITIPCPESGSINVLSNDTGEGISVTDFTSPQEATVTLLAPGTFQIDNVGGTSFSFSYTITDEAGQTSSGRVSVMVTLPGISLNPDEYSVNSGTTLTGNVLDNDTGNGLLVIDYTVLQGGSGEIMENGDLTFTPENGFCGEANITYTVEDVCGQQVTNIAIIDVIDATAPEITCPEDITIECDQDPDPVLTGEATATDNCDSAPSVGYADELGGTSCDQLITRTWTAQDTESNQDQCVQNIRVKDTTPPEIGCPQNISVECDQDPEPSLTGEATATDNCSTPDEITITYEDDVSGLTGCNETGALIRTWTATDLCDNSVSCEQIITITDETAPEITCPPDITIQCDEQPDPALTGEASGSDNCGPITIEYEDDASNLGADGTGNLIRLWTATDACGNATDCQQVILIIDEVNPTITCPGDLILPCDANYTPSETGYPEVADNCTPPDQIDLSFTDEESGTSCEVIVSRTWTAIDLSGNSSTCLQVITLIDMTAPEITCPPDINVTCGQQADLSLTGMPNGIDACSGIESMVFTDDLSNLNGCTGFIIREWQAADFCGNVSTCTQTITVETIDCDFVPGINIINADCGSNNGVITLDLSPPSNPYSIQWSTGENGPVIANLSGGLYTTTITDLLNNCSQIFELNVEEIPPTYIENVNGLPFTCSASGNIILDLGGEGIGPFDVNVFGPNNFSADGLPPGVVNLNDFGFIGEGIYNVEVIDLGAGTGCLDLTTIDIPFIPPYQLTVTNVTQPSSSSASDGSVSFTVDPIANLPLDVLVNGMFIGQSPVYNFTVNNLPEGTYDFLTIDDGGNGCESNIVTITLDAPNNGPDLEIAPLVIPLGTGITTPDLLETPWVTVDEVSDFIVEHPTLEPQELIRTGFTQPIGFSMGYWPTPDWQVRWTTALGGGTWSQDFSTGNTHVLSASGGWSWMQHQLGVRYYLPGEQTRFFLGGDLGLQNWRN